MAGEEKPIEAQIAEALEQQEKRLVRAAHETGFFKYRMPLKELRVMFKEKIDTLDPAKISKYERARRQKTGQTKKARDNALRIKILLGSYLIARLRKFPDQEPALLAGLDDYIASSKAAAKREQDRALIDYFRSTTGELEGAKGVQVKILLGAYLDMLVSEMPAEKATLTEGLEDFLRADTREWAVKKDLELFSAYLV